jgi:ribosomal protein S18 acetylase RimI-like enzyme
MTIREAASQHTSGLARLILLAIGDIAFQLTGETNETDALLRLETLIDTEGNRFSRSCILVKEDQGRLAGMILCYHGQDAERLYAPIVRHLRRKSESDAVAIDQEADPDEYYIDALAVAEPYQGRGYAKELLAAAEDKAQELGHRKIALNVERSNESAHRLYLKLGYQADKEITINRKPFRHMVKILG